MDNIEIHKEIHLPFEIINAFSQQYFEIAARDMDTAVTSINKQFSEGYAEEHPELVAALMCTTATNFGTFIMARKLADLKSAIESVVQELQTPQIN